MEKTIIAGFRERVLEIGCENAFSMSVVGRNAFLMTRNYAYRTKDTR